LAFFYAQVGGHHMIDGPIPAWLVTLSIVQSVMMLVPVVAFSVNQHLTMQGHFAMVRHSPTLRFVLLGSMLYTLASLQGIAEALRSINSVTHFTHFTVAHAHLGMYGFVAMVMFGAVYFALPRVLEAEWPFPRLISLHFWLVIGGFAIYFISLTTAGWLQGLTLQDGHRPFIDSVAVTLPYLKGRSIGGGLMTLGHFVFGFHVLALVLRAWRAALARKAGQVRLMEAA
jgi:cytochrome c oxidase cbb3-type subunit I